MNSLLTTIAPYYAVYLVMWLLIALTTHRQNKRFTTLLDETSRLIHPQTDEKTYQIHQPKKLFWFWAGHSIVAILFHIPFMSGNIFMNLTLFFLTVFATFYAGYTNSWRIIVWSDCLIIRLPLKAKQEIKIEALTHVKIELDKMRGYIHKKKVFEIHKLFDGYDLLFAQLSKAGKINPPQKKDGFTITSSKLILVFSIVITLIFIACTLIFIASGIGMYFGPPKGGVLLFIVLDIGFIAGGLIGIVYYFKARLTVEGDIITACGLFGKEKTYAISSVTRVEVERHQYGYRIVLYANEKKLFDVDARSRNFSLLIERLEAEGIIPLNNHMEALNQAEKKGLTEKKDNFTVRKNKGLILFNIFLLILLWRLTR